MNTASPRRIVTFELPWHTIARVLSTVALVWAALKLAWLFLLLLVAILLAVTLDPVVRSLESLRLPRWVASSLIVFALAGIVVGFAVLTSSQLSAQAHLVGTRLVHAEAALIDRIPSPWAEILGRSPERSVQSYLASGAMLLARGITTALLVFVLAVILTLYLLIEGRTTYAWLLAFVPPRKRDRMALTAVECQRVIFGYVAGNVATSIFAGSFVFVALTLLHVPAALLLAVLAAVCDFVPVLGFAISGIPAVMLALTVSSSVATSVVALYIAYHALENYFIAPYVYGDRLRLSNIAIVLGFAAGAELAGVVGALVALPIVAAYPAIERIWLRERLGEEVVEEHAAIERHAAQDHVHATP
jgi:putative heme transporter